MNKQTMGGGLLLLLTLALLFPGCSRDNPITGSEDAMSTEGFLLEPRGVTAGCITPPSDMVSWWPGEGTASDFVGENHGTAFGGMAFVPGKVGRAFSFDGIDDGISLTDADDLKLTASLSIEAWIYIKGYPPYSNYHSHILFRGDSRSSFDPYFLSVQPYGKLLFHIGGTTGNADLETPAPLPLNQLLHIAAVLDGQSGAMRIYIDGSQAAQAFTAVRPFRDLDPNAQPGIGIGNHSGNPPTWAQPFNGLIDELSIYSRALSGAEILEIFNAGANGKCKVIRVVADILPGSDNNPINPANNGLIPVAILTTEAFDATTVNSLSVEFGPNGAKIAHRRGHIEDVDGDGDLDLLLHFHTQETGITRGDTEACLTGSTFDGSPASGCGNIDTGEEI